MMEYNERMNFLRTRLVWLNKGILTVRDDAEKTLVSKVPPDQLRMLGDNFNCTILSITDIYYNIEIYEISTDREFSFWLMYKG